MHNINFLKNFKPYELYDFLKKNNGINICRNTKIYKHINLANLLKFPNMPNFTYIEDTMRHELYFKKRAHVIEKDYPTLLAAIFKIYSLTTPNDLLLFIGRTPAWLYIILALVNDLKNKNDYRNIAHICFSGGGQKKAIKIIHNHFSNYNDYKLFAKKFQSNIDKSTISPEQITLNWLVNMFVATKIVTKQRLKKYITLLNKVLSADLFLNKKIILIDMTTSGTTLHDICNYLNLAFPKEIKTENLYYLSLGKINTSSCQNYFFFNKEFYSKDCIKYLGSLEIPTELIEKLDFAPSSENPFPYYPPMLWQNKFNNNLTNHGQKESIKIFNNLVTFLIKRKLTKISKAEELFKKIFRGRNFIQNICT